MRLCHCLEGDLRLVGDDVEFSGIQADSRQIRPGDLFVALKGMRADGFEHAGEAVRRGAVAVLGDNRIETVETGVPKLVSHEPRHALARIASCMWPNQPETICAVTGTNGKSSTVEFLRQLWQNAGKPAASLGTLGLKSPAFNIDESLTTPDPVTLHQWLDQLTRAGITHLALEASSHGLDQFRLDGLRPAAAAFTNLSRDHLDYHGAFDAYFAAKLRLFTELLQPEGTAVVNADDPRSSEISAAIPTSVRVIDIGRNATGLRLVRQDPHANGQRIHFVWQARACNIDSALIGAFQAFNLLTAAALAIASGMDANQAFDNLTRIRGAKGRMQLAARADFNASAYIDYAHTPDALARALKDLRPHVPARLIVIFGCGGDRDKGKRPEMGAVAAKFADVAILTDDNPRFEDPASIRKEAIAGCPDAIEIGDRMQAIAHGVSLLQAGDVLLVAGKGHEQGQMIGDRAHPFDDLVVTRKAMSAGGLAA